ncbi:MAG: helix-turn-helix domain-containing protein [Candidatus Bathyarchaeia archaeon]|nr:helix-turn-helix domain-containing protein [Candidatus Bathyarchaeia archaeon]
MISHENGDLLTLRESSEYCGIPKKYLKNYVFKAGELKATKIRGRWNISKRELEEWKRNRDLRLTRLSMEEYFKAFEFAVRVFYQSGAGTVEWGTTKRRDVGEFIANQTEGKLGELAFAKFMHDHFGIGIELSFLIEKEIPGQDIVKVIRTEDGTKIARNPKIKVSIKTTKMQNFNLWVVEEDIEKSDVFVLCRVELPSDQLLRIVRDHEQISPVRNLIPEPREIIAEVAGFTWGEELQARGATMEMTGANGKVVQVLKRPQFIMLSGELRKSKEDWESLANAL